MLRRIIKQPIKKITYRSSYTRNNTNLGTYAIDLENANYEKYAKNILAWCVLPISMASAYWWSIVTAVDF